MKRTAILFITLALAISGCGKKTNDYNIENKNGVSHAEMDNDLKDSAKIEEEKIGAILKARKVQSYRDNNQEQLYNEYLYYIDEENHISKINEDTGRVDKILRSNEKIQDFTINNDRIFYYVNEDSANRLYFIDINEGNIKKSIENINNELSEEKSLLDNILINDDDIYYIKDNDIRIASISKGTTKSLLQENKFTVKELIDVKNDKLYFSATQGDKLLIYTMNTSGENLRIITHYKEEMKNLSEIFKIYGDYVYYINTDSVSRLIRMNEKGDKKNIFTGFDIKMFTVEEDLIYVLDGSEGAVNNLFVSYTDGKTKLIDDEVVSYDVVEGQIFYIKINEESKWGIYKSNINIDTDILGQEQLLLLDQNEYISEIKAAIGYVYYILKDGSLCRYNVSTGSVKEITNNVSELQRIRGAICYGNSFVDTLYLNSINVETIQNIDETQLITLINDFDNAWEDYVNEVNEEIMNYIVPQSPVTRYITRFDRNNVTEEFLDISVIDIRIDGDVAEIDVDEKLKKITRGEEKIIDYQWTYMIRKVDEEWKVYNYRAR